MKTICLLVLFASVCFVYANDDADQLQKESDALREQIVADPDNMELRKKYADIQIALRRQQKTVFEKELEKATGKTKEYIQKRILLIEYGIEVFADPNNVEARQKYDEIYNELKAWTFGGQSSNNESGESNNNDESNSESSEESDEVDPDVLESLPDLE